MIGDHEDFAQFMRDLATGRYAASGAVDQRRMNDAHAELQRWSIQELGFDVYRGPPEQPPPKQSAAELLAEMRSQYGADEMQRVAEVFRGAGPASPRVGYRVLVGERGMSGDIQTFRFADESGKAQYDARVTGRDGNGDISGFDIKPL